VDHQHEQVKKLLSSTKLVYNTVSMNGNGIGNLEADIIGTAGVLNYTWPHIDSKANVLPLFMVQEKWQVMFENKISSCFIINGDMGDF